MKTFLLTAITAALTCAGCGQQPPQPLQAKSFQTLNIGQTYNLTLVKGATQWPLEKVPLGGMTITIKSATQISGSFFCFVNGVQNGSATYTANVTWNATQVLISGFTATPANCQQNYYFTLGSTMNYSFMGPELELSDIPRQVVVQFVLQ